MEQIHHTPCPHSVKEEVIKVEMKDNSKGLSQVKEIFKNLQGRRVTRIKIYDCCSGLKAIHIVFDNGVEVRIEPTEICGAWGLCYGELFVAIKKPRDNK